ncbi:unannotated protein [freshwater metagenome]|uniref:Unannotated protein n=1 Tax=freshwater metagenome TaxID=449393 RepID=A0A6J6EWH8_9ZZZZ|nr:hypothetical protein [Actinomycetota bacterium]MTA37750.1 hypothetical protein [Actinomycetota bacterium]
MSTQQNAGEIRNIKGIRRIAVWTVVIALVITALIGIYTIVSGELGETQSKVMLTTLAVAAFSVLALCHLAIVERDVKAVGWIGIGMSALALVTAAILIWWDFGDYMYQPSGVYMNITKTFAISGLAALSLAHANLMLLLQTAPLRWIRSSLSVALILIAIVPTLVIPIILTDGNFPPPSFQDVYWRFFAVILILDALCTIALPVATLIVRGQNKQGAPAPVIAASSSKAVTLTLTGVAAAWVNSQAVASSQTAEQVVTSLIAVARKK